MCKKLEEQILASRCAKLGIADPEQVSHEIGETIDLKVKNYNFSCSWDLSELGAGNGS